MRGITGLIHTKESRAIVQIEDERLCAHEPIPEEPGFILVEHFPMFP